MTETAREHWDVIVIGSGIGGMGAAAALSRVGHRVLLLEQHRTLGGLTHSFTRDGFTWDVGVHYLSGVAPGDTVRDLLDWVSDTPIEFAPLGSIYDCVHIGSAEPLTLSRPYEAQERDLKDRYPDQVEAIEAWTHALREGRETMLKIFPTRAMPEIAGDILDWWNRRAIAKWCARTTQEVIDEITDHPELAAVMAAQWGDHGGRPGKASFAMHALIAGAFLPSGSWFPVGGSAAFADHIIPTITKNGGEARAGVRVECLLFEGDTVVGVRTEDGTEIRANAVISDIGARGDDYADFKSRVEETLMAQFESYFPDLAKLVVYRELATPLSTVSFTEHRKGAFYGLDVTPERIMCDALRAKTPIPGLFLAGQDVASPGIPGAFWGGLLSAASVDPKVFSKFRG